jgi:uncharacterized membrane protein
MNQRPAWLRSRIPRQDLYDFWRQLTNLLPFMDNIQRLDVIDARLSRWVVRASVGQTLE